MAHRRLLLLDPFLHPVPWNLCACRDLLIRLPTGFPSFGILALLDDDELALPENFSRDLHVCTPPTIIHAISDLFFSHVTLRVQGLKIFNIIEIFNNIENFFNPD